jgi:peroxiredoxin
VIRSILALLLCGAAIAAPPKLPRPSPNFLIQLAPGPGQISPAQYKGKAVIMALIMTTCPDCQNATQFLSQMQKEYGPRGLQVLGVAFNEDAAKLTPAFIQALKPIFPVGYAGRLDVVKYLGRERSDEIWVPVMVFIDRKGIIRYQHQGDDAFYKNNNAEKNIRAHIEELLKK